VHGVARRHLSRVDPALRAIIRAVPCVLPVRAGGDLFRTLVRAIAGQQLSTRAAATIFARLEATLGLAGAPPHEGAATPPHEGAATPPPSARGPRWPDDAPARVLTLDEAALRAVGLSTAKAASLRDLAARVRAGSLDLARVARMPDERVIEALTAVRGIGRWTAEMLLIFELGRSDVLPVHDLGIRKGMQKVYALRGLPDADAMVRRAEAWRPFRSVGSWYLWRALDAAPA
jgi:DNA-3-methyladenine glycosylase II